MRIVSAIVVIYLIGFGFNSELTAQTDYYSGWRPSNEIRLIQEGSDLEETSNFERERPEEAEIESPEVEDPYDEPLETDRHDFTQSPKVVGCGVWQFEYGLFYATNEAHGERETTYASPELLIRYGITERLELRTRLNYGWKYFSEDDDIDGGQDTIFSVKYQLSEQCRKHPETALELRLSAPTGADALSTGRWEPGFDYIYGWEFAEYFTFTGSTGANANMLGDIAFVQIDPNPDDKFIAWSQSAALGAKLTSKTTGYFEWFGIFTKGRDDEKSLSFLNFGIDYLINKNVVVDLRIGWGLTEESDDLFAGIGGAFRF